jgi:hypothetical protein
MRKTVILHAYRDRLKIGGAYARGVFSRLFSDRGGRVAWIVRVVKTWVGGNWISFERIDPPW